MRGHAQDVQVAVADLEREQDVEPPQDNAEKLRDIFAPYIAAARAAGTGSVLVDRGA
jgi:hypothetical protein